MIMIDEFVQGERDDGFMFVSLGNSLEKLSMMFQVAQCLSF